MRSTFNTIGLFFDIIGCITIFCGSFKMRINYKENPPFLELAQGRNNWAWRNIDRIGLAFLFIGFILQAVSNFICQ